MFLQDTANLTITSKISIEGEMVTDQSPSNDEDTVMNPYEWFCPVVNHFYFYVKKYFYLPGQ